MSTDTIPVAPLSIWDPVHLGTDELGRRVQVTLAERNMLIGGEPGGGKSVALQLIVAHGALSPDCRLILVDGKRVELGLWRDCAERFIGPSIDDAIDTLHWLQSEIDERTGWLLDHQMRKMTPSPGLAGLPRPHRRGRLLLRHRRHPGPAERIQRLQPRHRRPRPRPRHHPRRSHPAALRRHHPHQPAGPVRLPVGLPLLHRSLLATPSSGTAGPTRDIRPPKSTPKPAASAGCAPKTASPAASKPPTSPTPTSLTSPPGPPTPAPPTTPTRATRRDREGHPAARQGRRRMTHPHTPGTAARPAAATRSSPTPS